MPDSDDLIVEVTVVPFISSLPGPVELSNETVLENTAPGTVIGALSVANSSATWTASLLNDVGGRLAVSGNNLVVGLTPIDYEEMSTLSPVVQMDDGIGLKVYNVIEIAVADIGIEPPTDIQISRPSVVAGTPIGTSIGVITATDPDIGETFVFTIPPGFDAGGKIDIVGNSYRVADDIVLEDGSLEFRIQAEDAQGNIFTKDFSLAVVDITEGAIAAYFFDDFIAGGSPVVPNRMAGAPLAGSILRSSSGLFGNYLYWNSSGITVTENFAIGPGGELTASRLVGVGNWSLSADLSSFPAGVYTAGIAVKSNTGSPQDVRMLINGDIVTRTVTTSWARITHTADSGASAPVILMAWSSDGVTGSDILVDEASIWPGASDLGALPLAGHLVLGNGVDFADGELDMHNIETGLIQFPSEISLTDVTVQCVAKRVAGPHTLHPFVSKVDAYLEFTAVLDASEEPRDLHNGSFNVLDVTAGLALQRGGFDLIGDGYHLFTHRYDTAAGVSTFWVDDTLIGTRFAPFDPITIQNLLFNAAVNFTLPGDLVYASGMALWDRALSDQEIRQSFLFWQASTELPLTGNSTNRVLLIEGDSFENGFDNCWPYKFQPNADPRVIFTNYGVNGSTIAHLEERAPYIDAVLPPNLNGRKFILSVTIGINQLWNFPGETDEIAATAYAARLAAYCDARQAAGWIVVVGTILPTSTAAHNARRAVINSEITSTWIGVHCDDVIDFAAEPFMGPDAAVDDLTYYDVTGHPTDAGYVLLEAVARPVLNGI